MHDKDISIQKSISEVFDNINISCESTSVYFKRKWLPLEIIQNENIGLYNKKMQKWLNGL